MFVVAAPVIGALYLQTGRPIKLGSNSITNFSQLTVAPVVETSNVNAFSEFITVFVVVRVLVSVRVVVKVKIYTYDAGESVFSSTF